MNGMQLNSDAQLLRDFAESGLESAFAEIVSRHTNLVYSAALRQLDSPDLAADVAQNVFIGLARGARDLSRRLAPNASLAGWLCRSARNLSLNLRRDEMRRQSREKQAMKHLDLTSEPAPDWTLLRSALDDAMSELSEPDYDALVLRYFRNQDLRSVGLALGVSDDTAQKRVARALDKLHALLLRRGIPSSAASLSIVISANAVQAAPAGLAVSISAAAALAGTTLATTTTVAVLKTCAMTTIQKTLIGASLVAAIGTGFYEARQAARIREENQALRERQAQLTGQLGLMTREREEAVGKLAAAQQGARTNPGSTSETMRLRAEVARLQGSARELAQLKAINAANGNDPAIEATLRSWAARATQLKQRLGQMPDKGIPELQLVTEKDWFDAIKSAKQLETDADVRQALHQLRNNAKQLFGNMAREALKQFAAANNDQLPTELQQLKPYFDVAVDDAILGRYSLLRSGKLGETRQDEFLLAEKAPPVDDEYDSHFEFGLNGTRSSGINDPGDIIWNGLVKFAKAHNGQLTMDPSQLAPYLSRPLDAAKVQNLLGSLPPPASPQWNSSRPSLRSEGPEWDKSG